MEKRGIKYVVKKKGGFYPSEEMKKIANITDPKIYEKAAKDPIAFWAKMAKEGLTWDKEWNKTYEEKLPYFKWFKGGKLNFSVNCIDRHLAHPERTALIWVPEPTNEKPIKISYGELHNKVCKSDFYSGSGRTCNLYSFRAF